MRRASRQRASCARDVASRRDASIAPSWPGAPCALGAAELAAHPRLRPSLMPANHAGCSRRTRRGGAARAMTRHSGYRRRSEPRHGACVARDRIAKAPVSAEAHGVAPPVARGRVLVRRPITLRQPHEPAAACAHRSSDHGARWPALLCTAARAFKAGAAATFRSGWGGKNLMNTKKLGEAECTDRAVMEIATELGCVRAFSGCH